MLRPPQSRSWKTKRLMFFAREMPEMSTRRDPIQSQRSSLWPYALFYLRQVRQAREPPLLHATDRKNKSTTSPRKHKQRVPRRRCRSGR